MKEGKSIFRASDHQHVQDVLVGEAYGKELGLGHYKILSTVAGRPTLALPINSSASTDSCKEPGARFASPAAISYLVTSLRYYPSGFFRDIRSS